MSHSPLTQTRCARTAAPLLATQAALFLGMNAWLLKRMRDSDKKFSLYAKHLYNFDTVAFPALLAVSAPFLPKPLARVALGLAGLGLSARLYATHLEPRILNVHRVRFVSPKLRRPVRLLHISDMETDAVRNQEPKVIRRAQELSPDIVFHTGDLLAPIEPATYESELPLMADVWEQLQPPLGKIAVLGEVDRPIREELRQGVGGLRSLDGESRVFTARGFRLNVLGLTFEQSCNEDPREVQEAVATWLRNAAPEDFTILIGHRPDYILSVKDFSIDLCLAGHTHGGQVRVPGYGPLKTQSTVPDEWSVGFHQIGRTRLNVSAGVGFEHGHKFPAVRVNCPPEMTLFEILPLGDD